MLKNKIIDIDAEFNGIEFDEHQIKRYTAMKKANGTKSNNPEFSNKISKIVSKLWQDPQIKAQRTQQQKLTAQTEAWRSAHAQGMKLREANGWAEKNQAARKLKTIQTPHGVFPSKKAAIEAMTALGIGNAGGKLSVWLNTRSTEYYYLPKD
jgi:hypothetical protein